MSQLNSAKCLPDTSVRSHWLRAQSHKTDPISDVNPSCHLCFWPTGYKSKVPTTPCLSLINLQERLTKLRKPLYSLDCWFILNTRARVRTTHTCTTREQPNGRDARGEAWGQGTEHPRPLQCATLSMPPRVHRPGSSLHPSFWGFMAASSHRHDLINHVPSVLSGFLFLTCYFSIFHNG